ncbi:MAG: hypothetical protein MAG451_01190 [Anaerolineales bacterium]|nr:hypothetical protein [Anaerolineales bacterium]
MATTHSSEAKVSHAAPNYVAVFAALALLTAIEVGMTYIPMPRVLLILMLLAFAAGKAALVALYFMHLKFDSRLLTAVFVLPILLGGVLVYFLL